MRTPVFRLPLAPLLRWSARLLSVVSVGTIALFLVGEGFDPARVAWREWVGLAFFPGGVVVGLGLAWRFERLGALIALASLAAFYFVYGLWLNNRVFQGWAFLVFTSPAVLFLADWWLTRPQARSQER